MAAIWQSKLDKHFQCEVNRTSPHEARLTVRDEYTGTLLLNQEVTLSYDAQFGPDIADVSEWQMLCMTAVDKYATSPKH